jgi:hypothetical protein
VAIKTLVGVQRCATSAGREIKRLEELLSHGEALTKEERLDVRYSAIRLNARLNEAVAAAERLRREGVAS